MRRVLIAGNWKMNPADKKSARDLAHGVVDDTRDLPKNIDVVLCVPSLYISCTREAVRESRLMIGAQNCYCEDKGAFTGEISPLMLKDMNVDYVILGHSERRTLFGETDAAIAKKTRKAIESGLKVILCIGETESERSENKTDNIIATQLNESLADVAADGENLIIAYEPVWAIGTGKTCSNDEANRVCGLIRGKLAEMFSSDVAARTIIQYGGSVKPSTIADQLRQSDIDGALVGGASLSASEFSSLLKNASSVV